MKQTMTLLFFLLVAIGTDVLACESPPCYSHVLASLEPGDINANSELDQQDQRYFEVAANPLNNPEDLLTCLQIAGMDVDKNRKIDSNDLVMFNLSYAAQSVLPNSLSSWGDVDGNGMVDQADVLHYFDPNVLMPDWGDIDGNGFTDIEDAKVLKDCLSNKIAKLPIFQ